MRYDFSEIITVPHPNYRFSFSLEKRCLVQWCLVAVKSFSKPLLFFALSISLYAENVTNVWRIFSFSFGGFSHSYYFIFLSIASNQRNKHKSPNAMSSQLEIRRVVKSDESQIKDLFISDVYHWTRWVWPIVRYGIISLLAKPIVAISCLIFVISLWDLSLFLWLATTLIVLLTLLSVAKLILFLGYFWYMPEFVANNVTEFYSQPGFAFFVAELHGRIVACVAVQRKEDKVSSWIM